jgi:gliding motility-associated-like protein
VLDPNAQNPLVVTPTVFTDYVVNAIIGGCSTSDVVRVNTVAYPVANAGPDQSICYNTTAQLNGSTDGSSWSWSPSQILSNPAILNPVAFPPRTTDYVLFAYDTKGCPKPGRDTVRVTVYPRMHVTAGADTAVITGQPLQLNASGAEVYTWSPAQYLSATNIGNPIAVIPDPNIGIRYKVVGYDENGCADSAFVTIKVFKTGPSIFVPTAFTPNNDGRNDILRPIAVGMRYIEYFNVYNRWGQMVFSTKINGHGWDGRISGEVQGSGTYVWSVKAMDYLGRTYVQKGTFTLIK